MKNYTHEKNSERSPSGSAATLAFRVFSFFDCLILPNRRVLVSCARERARLVSDKHTPNTHLVF